MRFKKELIIQFMKEHNLSREEFALKCKFSLNTLNKFIKGDFLHTKLSSLFKLSKGLEIHVHELFDN